MSQQTAITKVITITKAITKKSAALPSKQHSPQRQLGAWQTLLTLAACVLLVRCGGSESPPPVQPPEPPVLLAVADSWVLAPNQASVQVAAPGLLGNDSYTGAVQLQITAPPTAGMVSIQADGSFSYQTAANFQQTDSFSYRLVQGERQSAAVTVTLSGDPSNQPKPATQRTLPVLGVHPGGLAYWESPSMADAMATAEWLEFSEFQWGEGVSTYQNPQFSTKGLPKYLNNGKFLRVLLSGLHTEDASLHRGRVVLTWQGSADIRLVDGAQFVAAESNGAETGTISNGRRVYLYGADRNVGVMEIRAIDPSAPISALHVWLSDPSDANNKSLENQLWHPKLLARIKDFPGSVLRTMDLTTTNANPQRDWADRRLPTDARQVGVLNPRSPAPGAKNWDGGPVPGDRQTGVAYEHLISLANQTRQDLWLNIPHLASDEFIDQLALLLKHGSDGQTPYASKVANPTFPPLDSQLRVWIEFSNEIWANGGAFAQGDYAQVMADAQGISKAQWNARQFCRSWDRISKQLGTERVVKVLATFTANSDYDAQLQTEVATYCPTLNAAIKAPDVVAVTTYFGNDIQGFVQQQAIAAASTASPWFYRNETFDAGGESRYVSLPANDAYWQSAQYQAQLQTSLTEWKRRLLSGNAAEGGGPDATGYSGGFELWVRAHSREAFGKEIPLVSYEGGPSVYTDYLDGGDERDDGITHFMTDLNSLAGMQELYSIHLNQAASKGLQQHNPFTLSGAWGKYGQWGHLRSLAVDPTSQVKYQAILQWLQQEPTFTPLTAPIGAVPAFVTDAELPASLLSAEVDRYMQADGGDAALTYQIIGSVLVPGLTAEITKGGVRLSGTPTQRGTSYLYLSVADGNGDRAWRVFVLRTIARSSLPAVTLDFNAVPLLGFGQTVAEPLLDPATAESQKYQFSSSGNAGLLVEHQFADLGWYVPWPSPVLHSQYWGGRIVLKRADGQPFDLKSLDLASDAAQSAIIKSFGADGYVHETTVNLPAERAFTTANLDLIEVYQLEIRWQQLADGQGTGRFGAVDNLRLNQP